MMTNWKPKKSPELSCIIQRTDDLVAEVLLSIYIFSVFLCTIDQMVVMSVQHDAMCWLLLQQRQDVLMMTAVYLHVPAFHC